MLSWILNIIYEVLMSTLRTRKSIHDSNNWDIFLYALKKNQLSSQLPIIFFFSLSNPIIYHSKSTVSSASCNLMASHLDSQGIISKALAFLFLSSILKRPKIGSQINSGWLSICRPRKLFLVFKHNLSVWCVCVWGCWKVGFGLSLSLSCSSWKRGVFFVLFGCCLVFGMMGRSQFVCLLILLQFLDSCFALPLCTDSSKSLIIEL